MLNCTHCVFSMCKPSCFCNRMVCSSSYFISEMTLQLLLFKSKILPVKIRRNILSVLKSNVPRLKILFFFFFFKRKIKDTKSFFFSSWDFECILPWFFIWCPFCPLSSCVQLIGWNQHWWLLSKMRYFAYTYITAFDLYEPYSYEQYIVNYIISNYSIISALNEKRDQSSIQAGWDTRKSLVKSPAHSMVSSEVRPDCSGRSQKLPKTEIGQPNPQLGCPHGGQGFPCIWSEYLSFLFVPVFFQPSTMHCCE